MLFCNDFHCTSNLTRMHDFIGPISGPQEAEFILKNTKRVHGFYGASSMERLPVEQAITNTMREYKRITLK